MAVSPDYLRFSPGPFEIDKNVVEYANRAPSIKTVISECASFNDNPVHGTLVLKIGEAVTTKLLPHLPSDLGQQVESLIKPAKLGWLLHDSGKTTSVLGSSDFFYTNKFGQDQRPDWVIIYQCLHSFFSGGFIQEIKQTANSNGALGNELDIVAHVVYSHQEIPGGSFMSSDQRPYLSYPRGQYRFDENNPLNEALFTLQTITRTADIAAAMGHGRDYRKYRLPEKRIKLALSNYLERIARFNGKLPLNLLLAETLNGLHQTQDEFPLEFTANPDCSWLAFNGTKVKAQPIHQIDIMAGKIFKSHHQRITELIAQTTKSYYSLIEKN